MRAFVCAYNFIKYAVELARTHRPTHHDVEIVHRIENEPITHALLCSFHSDLLPYSVS